MARIPSIESDYESVNYLVQAFPVDPSTGNTVNILQSAKPFYTATDQYEARLKVPFQFKRTAWSHSGNLLGGITQTDYGGIVVENEDGDFDEWPLYSWHERKVKVWFGLESDPLSAFKLLFEGKVDGVKLIKGAVVINVFDRKFELDDAVQQTRFEGTGDGNPNSVTGPSDLRDVLMPVSMGEVYGVHPVLINASISLWQLHDRREIEAITAARDGDNALTAGGDFTLSVIANPATLVPNGSYITNLANGLIRTGATPTDTLNVDVKGGKYQLSFTIPGGRNNDGENDPDAGTPTGSASYADTPGKQVEALLHYYGTKAIARDETAFSDFVTAVTAKTGFYLPEDDGRSRQDLISALAGPFGYWMTFGDDGLADIARLTAPTGSETNAWVFDHEAIQDVPEIVETQPPWVKCEVVYGRDYRYEADHTPRGTVDPKIKSYNADNPVIQNKVVVTITAPSHGDEFSSTGPNIQFTATALYDGTDDITSSIKWDIGLLSDQAGASISVDPSTIGTGAVLVKAKASKVITGTTEIEGYTIEGYASFYILVDSGTLPDVPPRVDPAIWRESVSAVIETMCVEEADAIIVANFWLGLHEIVRYIIRIRLKWRAFDVRIGHEAVVKYPRYGFDTGRGFIVLAVEFVAGKDETILLLWG